MQVRGALPCAAELRVSLGRLQAARGGSLSLSLGGRSAPELEQLHGQATLVLALCEAAEAALSLSSGEAEVAAAPDLAIAVAVAVAVAVALALALALTLTRLHGPPPICPALLCALARERKLPRDWRFLAGHVIG